jgi:pimeloyl-ACP methyl ester carboxylesterase
MDLIVRRDVVALRPYVERGLAANGFAWGMRYSVWCGEEVSFRTRGSSEKSKGKRIGSRNFPDVLARVNLSPVSLDVCRAWNVPPVPPRYTTPVHSKIPTLLIAGEYDPYTPPRWADTVSRTLPNSRVLTLRGMGHVPTQVWDQPCAMEVAAAFVQTPDRDPIRTDVGRCLENIRAPTFEATLTTTPLPTP